jgi:hypothetical protein
LSKEWVEIWRELLVESGQGLGKDLAGIWRPPNVHLKMNRAWFGQGHIFALLL